MQHLAAEFQDLCRVFGFAFFLYLAVNEIVGNYHCDTDYAYDDAEHRCALPTSAPFAINCTATAPTIAKPPVSC